MARSWKAACAESAIKSSVRFTAMKRVEAILKGETLADVSAEIHADVLEMNRLALILAQAPFRARLAGF